MSNPSSTPAATTALDGLLDECRDRMVRMYPATIRECVAELSDDQIWWRPNEASNSIGNMVLHLAGNISHYLGRGVVATGYERDRDAEFDERGPVPREELLRKLDETVEIMQRTFDGLSAERLLEPADLGEESRPIHSVLIAVTTHFNGHVGQIIYVTKMLKAGVFEDELWRRVSDR